MLKKPTHKYKAITELGGESASFVPLEVARRESKTFEPEPSQKEYVILSQDIPLGEVSTSSLQIPLGDKTAKAFEKARIFSLLDVSREAGLVRYECPLTLEEILTLLKVDGEGVIGYSEDYAFSFYLDYDKTGCVIELEFPKSFVS